ncbi:MAG: hypothetical protein ABMB14_23135 [Myxococcota bacterium]
MSVDQPVASDQGKMWALLSYASFFFMFPLGVIPLLQRDDPFALYHAKHATAVWLVWFVSSTLLTVLYSVITFVTCGFGGLLFPIILLPLPWVMIVGVHGAILSMNGEWAEPIGGFGLGEILFKSIQLKSADAPPQLPPSPPPPPVG